MNGIAISWPEVGAVAGVLSSVVVLQTTYLRLFVKNAILDAMRELNGKYVLGAVCGKEHALVTKRLDVLEVHTDISRRLAILEETKQ